MSKVHEATGLAVQQDAELQALLGEYGAEGLENITSDDVKVPRLAILQPTSPLSTEEGFRAGHIANIQQSVSYGNDVDVIPLFFWGSAVHGMNGDMASRLTPCHKGAACPGAQWVNDLPPTCTQIKNILVLPLAKAQPGETLQDRIISATPAVFSAKRTAIKGATEFLTIASMLRINGKPAPLFSSVYKFKTEKNDSPKGTYFTPKFSRVEVVKDVETFKYLRQLYIDMKAVSSHIESEVIQHESAEYTDTLNEESVAF